MPTPEEEVQDLRMRVQHLEMAYMAADSSHGQAVAEMVEGYERLEEIVLAAEMALDRERLLVPQEIRDELVCCDIYQRLEDLTPKRTARGRDWSAWKALHMSPAYHNICFYGEWSARIAEKVVKRGA